MSELLENELVRVGMVFVIAFLLVFFALSLFSKRKKKGDVDMEQISTPEPPAPPASSSPETPERKLNWGFTDEPEPTEDSHEEYLDLLYDAHVARLADLQLIGNTLNSYGLADEGTITQIANLGSGYSQAIGAENFDECDRINEIIEDQLLPGSLQVIASRVPDSQAIISQVEATDQMFDDLEQE